MDKDRVETALELIADDAQQRAIEFVLKDVTLEQLGRFVAKLAERASQPDQKVGDVLTGPEIVELWRSV
jgi:hypothetical protein